MKQTKHSHNVHINSNFSVISEEQKANKTIQNKGKITKKDKFRVYLFLSILLFCTMTSMILMAKAKANEEVQSHIAKEIIRFHVIANSDSKEDQALKILVKNALVQD